MTIFPAMVSMLLCLAQPTGRPMPRSEQIIAHSEQTQTMDFSKITNSAVKEALQAWQAGDRKTFLSYFTANPKMTDDGSPRDFNSFVKQACGTEKYLSINKVDNAGRDIYGRFQAGSWGTFDVFFKFHQNADGKFDRLDIGQAK